MLTARQNIKGGWLDELLFIFNSRFDGFLNFITVTNLKGRNSGILKIFFGSGSKLVSAPIAKDMEGAPQLAYVSDFWSEQRLYSSVQCLKYCRYFSRIIECETCNHKTTYRSS